MAYVAVDYDGTECIFKRKPKWNWFKGRWYDNKKSECKYSGGKFRFGEETSTRIALPKGTIENLINKKITADESPIKLR